MSFVTQKFLLGVNDRTKLVAANAYEATAKDLVWDCFGQIRDISGVGQEKIVAPIADDYLDFDVPEGYLEESTSYTFSITPTVNFASRSKSVLRSQYTDGPEGAEIMALFGRQMGIAFARAPEDLVISAIKSNIVTEWDNLATFHASHLIHPKRPSQGTFSNIVTSVPIDYSVSAGTALTNLSKAIQKMYEVPAPNGKVSQRLAPKYLVVPPALKKRALELTAADFLGATGGSDDVRSIVASNALTVKVLPELAAAAPFNGSDTTYYLCAEWYGEIGTFVIGQKEAFELVLFTPMSDSHADEQQKYNSRARGRIGIAGGMPQYTFRCGA